jgi:two-component system chemotaxis response regulator CheB
MMVSSLTSDGAQATFDALELGAVDFIPKQLSYVSLDIVKIKQELIEKVKLINKRKRILMARYGSQRIQQISQSDRPAKPRPRPKAGKPVSLPQRSKKTIKPIRIVAMGTSTGGPPALQAVVPNLPANFPVPVLIVQHMPPTFTKSLANRLDGLSKLSVKEAETGDRLEKGIVYIAPGDRHMTLDKQGIHHRIHLSTEPSDTLYKPSVDIMMISVAGRYGGTTLGVIMTGMGRDGLEGLKKIRQQGGIIIAQDEESCVVYGMPRAAAEAKITDRISPVERIAADIVSYF